MVDSAYSQNALAVLAEILTAEVFAVFLVFVRIGGAIMVMPGFGEIFIPIPVRLAIAVTISIALAPGLVATLPPLPLTPFGLALVVAGELVIGILIGAVGRLMMSALHVAGTIVAFQSSLAFALMFDPAQGVQGALIASLFSLMGIGLIFATDLHLVMIRALYGSYELFTPGRVPYTGDIATMGIDLVSGSFKIGIQMAAPFIVYGLIMQTNIGLLARLMPQLPFVFVAMPLQIYAAFFVLAMTISAAMLWFLTYYEDRITEFLIAR